METVNIIIEMEDGSVMKGELYPDVAPITERIFKFNRSRFFCRFDFSSGNTWVYDSRWWL